jgi:phosphosulfolactate synthase
MASAHALLTACMAPPGGTVTPTTATLVDAILEKGDRSQKPRKKGLTLMIDKGQMGVRGIDDFAEIAGPYCDYAKIAWGSSLITCNLEEKLARYRAHGIIPMIGGTLFEYAYLRNKVPQLLELAKAHNLHIELSDGVINLSHKDKLMWLEKFAKHVEVFSEVGGKIDRQDRDWSQVIRDELSAGAYKIVVEGREIGPVGKEIRTEFVDAVTAACDLDLLVFEAFERPQQVWLIKRFGSNVNLGNIPPTDLLTLESFRLGLKEHTLLHTYEQAHKSDPKLAATR